MNRRSFFKWLGVGTAGVAVAPTVVKAVESQSGKSFAEELVPDANLPDCDCGLRSFWEGPCAFHAKHPRCSVTCQRTMLHDHNAEFCWQHDVEEAPKGYADYASFSQEVYAKAIDDIVSSTARELGYHAGKELHEDLMRLTYDA